MKREKTRSKLNLNLFTDTKLYRDGGALSGDALAWVAMVHTAVAVAIVIFVIIHVYLLTTGDSFKEHVMPMVNGFDEVELSAEEEAYLEQDEPNHIR